MTFNKINCTIQQKEYTMARRWKPKYKVECPKCGWTGKRTNRMISKECPKCDFYYPKKSNMILT